MWVSAIFNGGPRTELDLQITLLPVFANDRQSDYTRLGHRRIGCVAGPGDETPSSGRIVGFRRALEDAADNHRTTGR